LQAGFNLDYGRFNEVHGTMYVSGPVSEYGWAIRLAVDAAHRDAWQYNYTRDDRNGEAELHRRAPDHRCGKPPIGLKFELNVNGSVDRSEAAGACRSSHRCRRTRPLPLRKNSTRRSRRAICAQPTGPIRGRRGVGTQSDTEFGRAARQPQARLRLSCVADLRYHR